MSSLTRRTLIATALLLGGASSWWFLTSRGIKEMTRLQPRYVGDQSCRDCHRAICDSYQRHPMYQTWQPLMSENTVEDFGQKTHVYDSNRDLHYEMISRGEQFFQKE